MHVFNILSQMHMLYNNKEKEDFLFSNEVKAKSLKEQKEVAKCLLQPEYPASLKALRFLKLWHIYFF